MRVVEAAPHLRTCVARRAARRDRDGDRVLLALVAHVGLAHEAHVVGGDALARERRRHRLLELRPDRARALGVSGASSRISDVRTKSWRMSLISIPSAEKWPGAVGTITSGHLQLRGEQRSMERAAAAAGDERELSRVAAAPDRDEPEQVDHARVRDAEDAARRRRRRRCRAARRARAIAASAQALVERHAAAHEGRGADPAGDAGSRRSASPPCRRARSRRGRDRRPPSADRP